MADTHKPPSSNPFSDHHYDLMCQGGKSCSETQEILERLQRAGMDTSIAQGENKQQYDLFTGLKREFFPDRP